MEKTNSKIYFDLDGVFADFFGEFAKTCGISSYKEYGQDFKVFLEYCEKHIHGTDFFLHLPKFEQTDKILEETHRYFGEFFIFFKLGSKSNQCSSTLKWTFNFMSSLSSMAWMISFSCAFDIGCVTMTMMALPFAKGS